jgi:1-acyl-sn-glycerol-3-phosphate acyltransferase
MKTVLWFLYLAAFLLASVPILLLLLLSDAFGGTGFSQQTSQFVVQLWARSLCSVAGVQYAVSGQENLPEGGFLMVSNHQGYFDIPILLSATDRLFGFVAKSAVRFIPVIGSWMRRIHCVSINREDPRGAMATLLDSCVPTLKAGHAVCIFPEGTRSRGETMRPFKKGAFVTAKAAGVPIVPVLIEGSYRIWETSPGGIRRAHVLVQFLPPIDPTQLTDEQYQMLPIQLHKQMSVQLATLRRELAQQLSAEQERDRQRTWRNQHVGDSGRDRS